MKCMKRFDCIEPVDLDLIFRFMCNTYRTSFWCFWNDSEVYLVLLYLTRWDSGKMMRCRTTGASPQESLIKASASYSHWNRKWELSSRRSNSSGWDWLLICWCTIQSLKNYWIFLCFPGEMMHSGWSIWCISCGVCAGKTCQPHSHRDSQVEAKRFWLWDLRGLSQRPWADQGADSAAEETHGHCGDISIW